MRRTVALAVLAAGVAAWVATGHLPGRAPAGAQTSTVEIGRVQEARFFPTFGRRPLYILAIGSDARPGDRVDRALADSLQLIGVNPRRGAATILGFPRDSYVSIPGSGTRKINDALLLGGPELVVRTVEELTGIPIDYYLLTSFQGLPAMVNAVGGIEVDVPYAMNDAASGAFFDAGPQVLDGRQALAFSRNRKDTPQGDFSRSQNQGLLLLAALEKLHEDVREDPARLLTWVAAGTQHVQTDLTPAEVFDLALAAMTVSPDEVTGAVTPGALGMAGGASVVLLGADAQAMFADMRDDGLIERP